MLTVEVDSRALEYVRSELSEGQALSRLAISVLDGMTTVEIAPNLASEERLLEFRYGCIRGRTGC